MNLINKILKEAQGIGYENKTVFHGTSSKYLINILKQGLRPNPNKYMAKYDKGEERKKTLRALPKELFVTGDLNVAIDFAKDACHYGGSPVVFSFVINSSDIIEGEQRVSGELVIKNIITPDRLTVVYPENFKKEKYSNIISKGKDKTSTIREINKVLKNEGWRLKSGSKTTDRILFYGPDNNYCQASEKLSDFKKHLMGTYTINNVPRFNEKINKAILNILNNSLKESDDFFKPRRVDQREQDHYKEVENEIRHFHATQLKHLSPFNQRRWLEMMLKMLSLYDKCFPGDMRKNLSTYADGNDFIVYKNQTLLEKEFPKESLWEFDNKFRKLYNEEYGLSNLEVSFPSDENYLLKCYYVI